MLFVGDDWAEAHHDIEIQDEQGRRLARRRLPEGVVGVGQLHALIAEHLSSDAEPAEVIVGIETDRGTWVHALLAAGYQVYPINPMSAARYRERHVTSGAKSDPGDAKVLADLVRTDRAHHRAVAAGSQLAEAIKVLARTHQSLIWTRQRHANMLRATLREVYPGALVAFPELAERDALAVLSVAPTSAHGRTLSQSKIAATLRRAGRRRNVEARATEIQTALRAPQLAAAPVLAEAAGHTARALVEVMVTLTAQIERLEGELNASFSQHPDAEILLSQPGLGPILAPRVLAEFGDDHTRYANPKNRKNYAGTSPITKASGTRRAVLTRYAVNKRLRDALYMQAFVSLRTSPGARAYYTARRNRGATHHQALRALGNRLVGILHGCLRHRTTYSEATAWHTQPQDQKAAA